MEIEPFRKVCPSAHKIWVKAGRPTEGQIYDAKVTTQNQYRYAVRHTKRAEKFHQAKGLFKASLDGDLNLMRGMKRNVKGFGPVEELSDMWDGVCGQDNAAKRFKEVY